MLSLNTLLLNVTLPFESSPENVIAELVNLTTDYSELKVRHAMENTKMLSSDVSAGFDPLFAGVNDAKNSAYLGNGICFNKYTGASGKSGCNDAMPEYFAEIRKVMDENDINYQTAELGKVDQGGGGTIAYILGNYNMNVIDAGIAVLNMHAPMEIVSKADVYEAYCAYKAFSSVFPTMLEISIITSSIQEVYAIDSSGCGSQKSDHTNGLISLGSAHSP